MFSQLAKIFNLGNHSIQLEEQESHIPEDLPIMCLDHLLQRKEPLRALVLGRRATGKSSLVKELIKCHIKEHGEDGSHVLVFHGPEQLQPFYANAKFEKGVTIKDHYDRDILESYLQSNLNCPSKTFLFVFDNCFQYLSSRCEYLDQLVS